MPAVEDYDPNEDQQTSTATASGGSAFGGGAGGTSAQATPQKEAQFTPWSRFVSANADVSKREAGKLASGVQNDVNAATSARDAASKAQEAGIKSNYSQPEAQGGFGSVSSAPSGLGVAGSGFGRDIQTAPQPVEQRLSAQPLASAGASGARVASNDAATLAGPAPQIPKSGQPNAVTKPYGWQTLSSIDPNRLQTDTSSGAPVTSGVNIAGNKSLEAQLGAPGWSKLLGDTQHAQEEAGALGSEGGVQSLIQKQAAQPLAQGGAFDAALINGQGGKQFADLAKQYGGNQLTNQLGAANQSAEDRWHKLMGDIDNAAHSRDATINAANTPGAKGGAGDGQDQRATLPGGYNAGATGWHPDGYSDLNSFLHPNWNDAGNIYGDVHQAGQALSPADWLSRAAGELGYSGQGASEMFGSMYSGGALNPTWAAADARTALSQVQSEYGNDAVQFMWDHMDQPTWQSFMNGGNPGNMSRLMRAWLESHGYKKIDQHGQLANERGTNQGQSEVSQAGYSAGNADAGTTAEEETARNQIAMGIPYTDANGKTWTSVSDWDAAHKK